MGNHPEDWVDPEGWVEGVDWAYVTQADVDMLEMMAQSGGAIEVDLDYEPEDDDE